MSKGRSLVSMPTYAAGHHPHNGFVWNETNHDDGNDAEQQQERLRQAFVLPDFQTVMQGFVKPQDEEAKPNEQLLMMESERITVPEVLFSPADVGLQQAGLPEVCWQSLQALDEVREVNPTE